MKIHLPASKKARIEMLPLIDIVFLLLVFFIYAMLSMAVHRGLPVELPLSTTAEIDKKLILSVTVEADAVIYVDKERVALADLTQVALFDRVIGAHLDRVRITVRDTDIRIGDVLGNVDNNGARSAGRRNVERLFDRVCDILDPLDQEVVFDAGARDADRVDLLKGIRTDHRGGYLSGQDHHRYRVHVSGGDTGDRIGGTRSRCDQNHPDLPGRASVAIRGMRGALLVAYQDMAHVFLREQGVVDVQYGAARVTPDKLHALVFECLNDDLGTTKFHLDDLPRLE